ncbi:MAG: class I adenylate-forming enzyme family protein [Hyphomonadaceae bacterium]
MAPESVVPTPRPSAVKRFRYRAAGWWGDRTLGQMFLDNATRHPERTAVVDAPNRAQIAFGEPRRLSYAQLRAEVDRLAAALLDLGIGKGAIVLVQMPNISELVALYFACARVGAIVSPLPVQYRAHELAQIVEILRPQAFVCCTQVKGCEHTNVARPLLDPACHLLTFGPAPASAREDLSLAEGDARKLNSYCRRLKQNADDIFTICWTSGTTGAPKGVPRSHNHWVAIAPATYQPAALRDGDVLLNPFPMINMASIGGVTMSWLRTAGVMVLHHPFDASVYLQQIASERPAFTIAPPAILNMLLKDEALLQRVDLSSLRTIGSGSAPLAPAMVRGFQERFGIRIINLFGSNEGMSLVSGADDVPDPDERASYFPRAALFRTPYGGKPKRHLETRLISPATGRRIVKPGLAGELEIRGPSIFEGYFRAPEQTRSAFTRDGFFRTGDLFEIAGGGRFYRFAGRCKDLIIRGGYNVSPEEIDQLLGGHPQLAEACAFGLPDPTLGERIGVAIVPKSGETVGLAEVADFLKARGLAQFKLPERVYVFDALPRNALNKVLRTEVLARALEMDARAQTLAPQV